MSQRQLHIRQPHDKELQDYSGFPPDNRNSSPPSIDLVPLDMRFSQSRHLLSLNEPYQFPAIALEYYQSLLIQYREIKSVPILQQHSGILPNDKDSIP